MGLEGFFPPSRFHTLTQPASLQSLSVTLEVPGGLGLQE